MKISRTTLFSIIFAVIALVIIGYVVWYQGAQEDALDYGTITTNASL